MANSNRKIAFRAWDTTNKRMIPPGWWGVGSEDGLMFENEANHLPYDGKEVIMQYTGLKDKNGKKIYEGDIVRYRGYDEEGAWIQEEQIHAIDFSSGAFFFGGVGMYEWIDEKGNLPLEIIGNIYENPDLLK